MDIAKIPVPAYIIDKPILTKNLEVLNDMEKRCGCHILLPQRGFSIYNLYSFIGKYISGTTSGSLNEAILSNEEMKKENHIFKSYYLSSEIDEIVKLCDHVSFNSIEQLMKYKKQAAGKTSIGLRINPGFSNSECNRYGVTLRELEEGLEKYPDLLDSVDGFYFNTINGQDSDAVEDAFINVEEKFGEYLKKMKWINMGGGKKIAQDEYDVEHLIALINDIKEEYKFEVYLEPMLSVAFDAGFYVTEVLGVIDSDYRYAVLNGSVESHLPGVRSENLRPNIAGSGNVNEKEFNYRIVSNTSSPNDVFGDYSFDHELECGERLYFEDMAANTIVRNNTYNGVDLPQIWLHEGDGKCKLIKKFEYADYKSRLS